MQFKHRNLQLIVQWGLYIFVFLNRADAVYIRYFLSKIDFFFFLFDWIYVNKFSLTWPRSLICFTSCPFPGAAWWSSWPARSCCWKTLHQTRSSQPRCFRVFPASCHRGTEMHRSNWNNSPNSYTPPLMTDKSKFMNGATLQNVCDDSNAPVKNNTRLLQSCVLWCNSAESGVITGSYHMSASNPSCS